MLPTSVKNGTSLPQGKKLIKRTKEELYEMVDYLYIGTLESTGTQEVITRYKLRGKCPRFDESLFDSQGLKPNG